MSAIYLYLETRREIREGYQPEECPFVNCMGSVLAVIVPFWLFVFYLFG